MALLDACYKIGLRIMEVRTGDRIVELSEDQLTMYNNLTKLQKSVTLGTLAGMKPADAHRNGGGNCRNEDNRHRLASEILTKPDVKAFIDSFAVTVVSNAIMGRQEMLERLTIMARTQITDVVNICNNPVIDQESGELVSMSAWSVKDPAEMTNGGMIAISEITSGKDGLKLKLHDQRAAMKQLAELQGFDAASKIELSGTITTRTTLDDFYGTDA